MNLKEFVQKKPSAVKEAAKCKDISEFEKLVQKYGIEYENHQEIEYVWSYLESNSFELDQNELSSVAGGKNDVKQHWH